MSIGLIPALISVHCRKAVTQASLLCFQEECFCLQEKKKKGRKKLKKSTLKRYEYKID